ncbi:MAG: hypothetical protein J5808_02290 [Paludibacteraceae bacterium]|nr:hypothetical protein [Paludibacteraceae bacterium]
MERTRRNFRWIAGLITVISGLLFCCCTPQDKLKGIVSVLSAQCPIEISSGLIVNDIKVIDGNLVYKATLQESDTFSAIELNHPLHRRKVEELLQNGFEESEPGKKIIGLVKEAGADIIFQINGSKTGQTVNLTIPCSNLE